MLLYRFLALELTIDAEILIPLLLALGILIVENQIVVLVN